MGQVLVLNENYMPLGSISWQRAVVLLFNNKIEVLEYYSDKVIKTVNSSFKMPSVIRLLKWVRSKLVGIRFNRRNIYARDYGKCQYCQKHITFQESTLDHVIPKSKGGKTDWNNIVTACVKCNVYKDSKLLEETGMKLLKIPIKPTKLPLEVRFQLPYNRSLPEQWKLYLNSEDLDDD